MSAARFRAETRTTETGAVVELGTMTFEGRDFAALGSIVDVAGGHVVGYVREDAPGRYTLTTWEGAAIAPLRLVAAWRQRVYGGTDCRIYSWRATIEGRSFYGRCGFDFSSVLRMRATRA